MNQILKNTFKLYGCKGGWLNFVSWLPIITLLGCVEGDFITLFIADGLLIAIAIGSQFEYWRYVGEIPSKNATVVSLDTYKSIYGYSKITWLTKAELAKEIELDDKIRSKITYLTEINECYESYYPKVAAESFGVYLEKDSKGYYKLYPCLHDRTKDVKIYF